MQGNFETFSLCKFRAIIQKPGRALKALSKSNLGLITFYSLALLMPNTL